MRAPPLTIRLYLPHQGTILALTPVTEYSTDHILQNPVTAHRTLLRPRSPDHRTTWSMLWDLRRSVAEGGAEALACVCLLLAVTMELVDGHVPGL